MMSIESDRTCYDSEEGCPSETNHSGYDSPKSHDKNLEPYIGIEFEDLDSVYIFYNAYARNHGFGIRKNSSAKSQVTKDLIWKNYVCDKAGTNNMYTPKEPSTSKKRYVTRMDCKAKLDVRRSKEGKWVVTGFEKQHTHELDTPRRTIKHRSHNVAHKSIIAKNAMDNLHEAGLGPSKIAKTLNATGVNTDITAQNVIDHLRIKRKNNIGREGVLVAQYLQAQLIKDSNFYFALELDSDGMLRSLFWADSRARNDYITFGDVIVFDVTYKTNRLMMPFAPFTGVNHHRQSMLLGCALLADETEDTFIWLFKHWLTCMFDKHPLVIITDMDRAMYNAIKIVFPNSRHRFCSWHINKHLIEHVSDMRDTTSEFGSEYRIWYNSRTIQQCEVLWQDLIARFELQNNKWLAKMWNLRHHWVPIYLKDTFVAGMTSTGRSESINSFFDGFVNSNTQLPEFVVQYEKALLTRRHSEEVEDYKTLNSAPVLLSNTNIETYASKVYTRAMFRLFQNEYIQSLECGHQKLTSNGNSCTYLVGLSSDSINKWYKVVYEDFESNKILCECAKFVTDGFICKHIIHMFFKKQIFTLPPKYIIKRWTIHARHMVAYEEGSLDNSNCHLVTPIMKWDLTNLCHKLVEKASISEKSFMKVHNLISSQLDDLSLTDETTTTTFIVEPITIDITSIRDPIQVRTKGRPKIATRMHSSIEISQTQVKKRTCGACGEKGHYSTTCPKNKKD